MRLILASGSPRRAELLSAAGYSFDVRVPDIDERARPGESPFAYVERLAAEKAARIAETLVAPDAVVLAADTAVVIDDEILGKPADDADAARMLRLLSGRAHLVMTGVAAQAADRRLSHVETTAVYVDPLTDEQVAWYVRSGEGKDKAGGYAIQGLASRFVPRIEGSYSNVVGLPLAAVTRLLSGLGNWFP
jgi:septum formation protein